MIVRVRDLPNAQGRYEIFEVARGGSAADEGPQAHFVDESVDVDLCSRLMARTGAFWYAEGGALHEDTDWQPPEVP